MKRSGGKGCEKWTWDFRYQAVRKFILKELLNRSGTLKGQTNLMDVQYWIWKRPSLVKGLVASLRHLGPSYMLQYKWIRTQGKVANTLTRLLWDRKVVSLPFNEFMAPGGRAVFNISRISCPQAMWRNWAPNIPVPTFDYLQSIPALWMENNR